jgi:hypothetical protein
MAMMLGSLGAWASSSMSSPEVEAYNIRVGTQQIGGLYHFSTNTLLVDSAEAIHRMGPNNFKFYMGSDFLGKYGLTLASSIRNLTALAQQEPSCHRVLDLPFQYYFIWTYCFGSGWWADGFSTTERQAEYDELYAFTQYLLTNYNNTGKTFYLGHWEGDWHLLEGYDPSHNPTPTAIQGMRDWLNTRQRAIDDAKAQTPYAGVEVWHYTEVNRVLDALSNPSASNQRVINTVVPYVTNLDYLSWSSYEGQNLSATALNNALNYMAGALTTNKAAVLKDRRVFVGEYGWGGSLSTASQESPTRAYVKRLMSWGCPFILFWEMYNNETGKNYCLVDPAGRPTLCYEFHRRFINTARLWVAEFQQDYGRLPVSVEFQTFALPLLDQPLPVPASLVVSNAGVINLTAQNAVAKGWLTQGVYGEEWAVVSVGWGLEDGGNIWSGWANRTQAGTNVTYGQALFSVPLGPLEPQRTYYYRFYATNAQGEAWAPLTGSFQTPAPPPAITIALTPFEIILCWPASVDGYALFAAPNLQPPISWTLLTNAVEKINGLWTARVKVTSGLNQYFQLKLIQPPGPQ